MAVKSQMPKIAVCSICSKNYFAHARVLFRSIKAQHPDWDCHFLLADEPGTGFEIGEECFSIAVARDLGIPGFMGMAFRYDVIELNVALKPFLIKHLLALGYDRVIYFDVDIRVFSGLTPITEALDSASILITPHITTPLPKDIANVSEDIFLKCGTYNLGFIAVSLCEETISFLDWWAERCLSQCIRETETGLFVDQKWINLVPGFYPQVKILRHLGCNMAYWNLHERRLNGTTVNGKEPLVFFHYSGIDVSTISAISKYQKNCNLQNRSDLADIFKDYQSLVLQAGHEQYRNLPYHYGRYENGELISLIARRLYAQVQDKYPNPFAVGPGTYHELLRRRGLLSSDSSHAYGVTDAKRRGRSINLALKVMARLLGGRRYEALMAYLRYITVLSRQKFLID